MLPDVMQGCLECLCQQLKTNPSPTHGENRTEREPQLCVASGERPQLHLFREVEAPVGPRECRARHCPVLPKRGFRGKTSAGAQLPDDICRGSPSLVFRLSRLSVAFCSNNHKSNRNEMSATGWPGSTLLPCSLPTASPRCGPFRDPTGGHKGASRTKVDAPESKQKTKPRRRSSAGGHSASWRTTEETLPTSKTAGCAVTGAGVGGGGRACRRDALRP